MNPKDINGYPSLADFVASDRDGTTLIFRRFDRLAARTLLHQQSELAQIEADIDTMDKEDAETKDVTERMRRKRFLRNWNEFAVEATKPNNKREAMKMELLERAKVKLKEYREALVLGSTMCSLPRPRRRPLRAFQQYFDHKLNGEKEPYPMLGGTSEHLYRCDDEACKDDSCDLVTLKVEESPDRLTAFTQDYLSFLFSDGRKNGKLAYASDRKMANFVLFLSILFASGLLIGAIISLYVVTSPKARLGMIAAFTTVFAGGVGLLTNARKAEVFAATAAYSAVLVVFVSGDLGSTNQT